MKREDLYSSSAFETRKKKTFFRTVSGYSSYLNFFVTRAVTDTTNERNTKLKRPGVARVLSDVWLWPK